MPRRSTPNLGPAKLPERTPPLLTGSVARDPSWDTMVKTLVASEHARRRAASGAAAEAAAPAAAEAAAPADAVAAPAAPITPPKAAPVTPPKAAAAVAPVAVVAPVAPVADPFAPMARPAEAAEAAEDDWDRPAEEAPALNDLVPIEELMADPAWLPNGDT